MKSDINLSPFKNLKNDIPASIIVFLVAMPLCLGIALASGAPLFAGLLSGIVGGIVVGAISGSPLGVSGPAAGLAVIVFNAITDLGSFEVFLLSVLIAGILQVIMGYAKAGIITYYFPSSVIHGMLAGIGVLIFVKQIPHAFGYDENPEGNFAFAQPDGQNTFSELSNMLNYISPGALVIAVISLAILILWETKQFKEFKPIKYLKGPLVAVVASIALNFLFADNPTLAIQGKHLVSIPLVNNVNDFFSNFTFPDFTAINNPDVYVHAIILAVVASIEGLLCAEASDKQDTLKRTTPANLELKAEGVGNIVCGLLGALPLTQVIVRSSVNQQSGGKTKASAVSHGILLLLSIIIIPHILNLIPLATLAAILIVVGYKLAKPELFIKMYKQGRNQFIPFVITVLGILFTDLLMGIGLGMVIAVFIILRNNYIISYRLETESTKDNEVIKMLLSEDVTFLNKASIQQTLDKIPNDTILEIDGSNTYFIHHDVMEMIENFEISAQARNIEVRTIGLFHEKEDEARALQHFELVTAKLKKIKVHKEPQTITAK